MTSRKKSAAPTGRTIRLSEASDIIKHAFKIKRAVFLTGQPGVGKSDLIAQIGVEQKRPVVDMRLLLCEPSDLKGIPYFNPETKQMDWAAPSELPSKNGPLANAILFLDEMNAAPPATQAAAYQLILNRRVGQYELPEAVDIIAAGNRQSDKGVTYRMPTPLANRFIHIEVDVNFDDWQTWALENNVHPDVVGYLSNAKHHLNQFDPAAPGAAFATPRTWTFVSDIINQGGLSEHLEQSMIAGTIGEGVAGEFFQHRKFASKLPSAADVLSGKVTKLDVKEISAHYAMVVNLTYTIKDIYTDFKSGKTKQEDFDIASDHFFKFLQDNFEPELCILAARTAVRYPVRFDMDREAYDAFIGEYKKFIIAAH